MTRARSILIACIWIPFVVGAGPATQPKPIHDVPSYAEDAMEIPPYSGRLSPEAEKRASGLEVDRLFGYGTDLFLSADDLKNNRPTLRNVELREVNSRHILWNVDCASFRSRDNPGRQWIIPLSGIFAARVVTKAPDPPVTERDKHLRQQDVDLEFFVTEGPPPPAEAHQQKWLDASVFSTFQYYADLYITPESVREKSPTITVGPAAYAFPENELLFIRFRPADNGDYRWVINMNRVTAFQIKDKPDDK